jgi:PAS domain S-box-containing protein
LALAASELGTWEWDLGTGVTRWDATLARLFGLAPVPLEGTFEAWVARLHPDDVDRALAAVDRMIADKADYVVEHRVIWPDGSVHWLHVRGAVRLDDNGTVIGAVGYSQDVTERKLLELEAAVRALEAERAAEGERLQRVRLEFLTGLDSAVMAAVDHRKLMRDVTAAAVPHLGDWCAVHFLPGPGGAPDVEVAHRDPDKVRWAREILGRFPYDPQALTGVPAVIRTGRLEFIRDVDEAAVDAAIDGTVHATARDELRSVIDELRLTSVITVPLHTKRGVVGAMQFVSAESGRRYDHEDVALAQAVAGRVAEALHHAWLTEQHRTIADTLQAALLPPQLPVIDGVSVAVRYWPAGTVNDVGGDFYDVFRIDEARWAVVIGDVCGTGPDAAAVTVIARHTIRAAAKHSASHHEVLEWTNDALHAGGRDRFCTAIYSTLTSAAQSSWLFTSIAAGHPLPILVRADGTTTTIGQPGTLLGVLPTVKATTAVVRLDIGDTVVLYTDGLTDVRPPHDLDPDRLARLVSEAASSDGSAEQVAGRLAAAIEALLPVRQRDDDLALVVLRVMPTHEACSAHEH